MLRDQKVLVAVTAFGGRRIVVSEAALRAMDAEGLKASFAHELGHIHPPPSAAAAARLHLVALGRALPGTTAAERELAFHLERDADEYAVGATSDPLALASAICKAAVGAPAELTALGRRGRASVRLSYLVDGAPSRGNPLLERGARALAGVLVVMALALTVSLPAWALAAPRSAHDAGIVAQCGR